jgi:hypothetical protein
MDCVSGGGKVKATSWADKKLLSAARKEARSCGYKNPSLKIAWVIVSGQYGFERCMKLGLWELVRQGGNCWLDRWGHAHYHEDTFEREIDARNDLEKRLYTRAENLSKHRKAMTDALVQCALWGEAS